MLTTQQVVRIHDINLTEIRELSHRICEISMKIKTEKNEQRKKSNKSLVALMHKKLAKTIVNELYEVGFEHVNDEIIDYANEYIKDAFIREMLDA